MLGRRRSDLEREIMIARGTDFANPDTAQVSIGTTVTVRDTTSKHSETYHILGAWDSDLEKGIISYKTAVAQALIGHKIGTSVSLASETGERPVEILSIDAWHKN